MKYDREIRYHCVVRICSTRANENQKTFKMVDNKILTLAQF